MMALLNTSCQAPKVEIKDQAWFADKGPLGATEFHTMKNIQRPLNLEEWDQKRFGMLCTTRATFGEIKKEIELLCSFYKNCDYPDVQNILLQLDKLQGIK